MKNPTHPNDAPDVSLSENAPTRMPAARRLLLWLAIAALLALVFIAYLRPAFVLDLANRIVLCF